MPYRAPIHQPVRRAQHIEADTSARGERYARTRNKAALALYRSKEWRKARASFLLVHTRCGCGAPATVVDHIVPHRGDPVLFWDRTRWRAMCQSCHSVKTAKRDGGFGNSRIGMTP